MLGVERGGIYFHSGFGCLLIIKYILFVLLLNVLLDLGVKHFIFLWLSS